MNRNKIFAGIITIVAVIAATILVTAGLSKIINIINSDSTFPDSMESSENGLSLSSGSSKNLSDLNSKSGFSDSSGINASELESNIPNTSNTSNISNTLISSNKSDTTTSIANSNQLKVYFFDVGQADSCLIVLPNKKTILIDAGEYKTQQQLANMIRSAGVKEINALIATHPHADHIGGMSYIINNFNVEQIFMSKTSTTTKTFETLLTTIAIKKTALKEAKSGVLINLDNEVSVKIIAPINYIPDELNENSVVIKLVYKGKSFLFMGDAGIPEESTMLDAGVELKSDVLKVGHHGSHYSTSNKFIEKVLPKYAIISVGKNNEYGHPSQTVIDKLEDIGSAILRTDLSGTIVILSDGINIETQFVK